MDDLPETEETFFVSLLSPTSLGRLSETATIATISIQANQNPFGVLELSVVGVAGSQISVEEDVGSVEFELTRSFGTFGDVSVTLDTVPGTAVSIPGENLQARTSACYLISLLCCHMIGFYTILKIPACS